MPDITLTDEQIDTLGTALHEAWTKYCQFFGEPPHGTLAQMKALVAVSGSTVADALLKILQMPVPAIPSVQFRVINSCEFEYGVTDTLAVAESWLEDKTATNVHGPLHIQIRIKAGTWFNLPPQSKPHA